MVTLPPAPAPSTSAASLARAKGARPTMSAAAARNSPGLSELLRPIPAWTAKGPHKPCERLRPPCTLCRFDFIKRYFRALLRLPSSNRGHDQPFAAASPPSAGRAIAELQFAGKADSDLAQSRAIAVDSDAVAR